MLMQSVQIIMVHTHVLAWMVGRVMVFSVRVSKIHFFTPYLFASLSFFDVNGLDAGAHLGEERGFSFA